MPISKTLPAFTSEQFVKAHYLLASRVATMMGRKLEEGDWTGVYCAAKGIPTAGWSNLNIDIVYSNLGIEHKMLCVESDKSILGYCGRSLMHPSATRSIRIPSLEGDATETARDVLRQYGELINQRQKAVALNAPDRIPDMRTGWLLWQESLREFLYFEEAMQAPNPVDFWAQWQDSGGGARKASRNLWVYENSTGRKRYSITTSAGAKIQPYFDVPPPNDPNLYHFVVQGEQLSDGSVRVWVTPNTAFMVRQKLGTLERGIISQAIISVADKLLQMAPEQVAAEMVKLDVAESISLTLEAYQSLATTFPGVSDEHKLLLFARYIWRS